MALTTKELIVRSLQNAATEDERRRLNEWLREDPQHVAEYSEMHEIIDSRRMVTEAELESGWDELSRRIATFRSTQSQEPPAVIRRFVAPEWLRYAAAVAAGIIVTLSVWFAFARQKPDGKEIIVKNVIFNYNGIRKIELPDRSVVWMNGSGKLIYADDLAETQRNVVLEEGNAFFEIAKDTLRPFTVEVQNLRVRVTGTSFFVCTDEENHTKITLVTGGVELNRVERDGSVTTLQRLSPGQEADYDRLTASITVNNVETDYYTAWKDGTYRFSDETLANIARQMEYHFGIKVELSASLKAKRFTGLILPEHTVKDVMEIIRRSYPIKYRLTQSSLIISE
ncbi:MAG: FecR domain-containing protein [Tannerella sp.]|jgi:ferric-dicitrate binding protein FerR (iron transport regulator)|nr:FecR domain-containing protein [Tannerella sp.]